MSSTRDRFNAGGTAGILRNYLYVGIWNNTWTITAYRIIMLHIEITITLRLILNHLLNPCRVCFLFNPFAGSAVTCPPLFNMSSEASSASPITTSATGGPGSPIVSQNDTRMGAIVGFSCPEGQNLAGEAEIECLPSGRWSAGVPYCRGKLLRLK